MPNIIEVVVSDLKFLLEEWDDSVDDHSLRRSSPVLRRLLVHNDLQKAWLDLGMEKEPQIKVSTLSSILQSIPKEKITFASAGGAKYKGMELRGALMANYAMSPEEIKQNYSQGIPEEILGLRAFINAPTVVINGQEISRRTVIKFIANKLGGDHFDQKRNGDAEETQFSLLDQAASQIKLADKNAIYFELLSAGQALINADDIRIFMEKSKEKGYNI